MVLLVHGHVHVQYYIMYVHYHQVVVWFDLTIADFGVARILDKKLYATSFCGECTCTCTGVYALYMIYTKNIIIYSTVIYLFISR